MLENSRRYQDCLLLTSPKAFRRQIANPLFHGGTIISPTLFLCKRQRYSAYLCRPIFVGVQCLDYSVRRAPIVTITKLSQIVTMGTCEFFRLSLFLSLPLSLSLSLPLSLSLSASLFLSLSYSHVRTHTCKKMQKIFMIRYWYRLEDTLGSAQFLYRHMINVEKYESNLGRKIAQQARLELLTSDTGMFYVSAHACHTYRCVYMYV